ncbi:MAG: flagellar synthesis regulator FleN [Myxococcales bacterium]|nr:flagellar synthesis regulator FleN [Myxococcales bacterium]
MSRNGSQYQDLSQLRTPSNDGPTVLTVASGKGGVGKTHLSVNVAVCLADMGYRVLVVDGDLGLANVNVLLGINPGYHAGHLLDGTQPFDKVVDEIEENLHILPAGSAMVQMAELDMASQVRLLERLDLYRRPYDFVLIDASAGIGANVRLALAIAHQTIVVMNPEMTSLTDAYALVKVAFRSGCKGPFQVVVNRVRLAEQAREMHTCLSSAAGALLGLELEYAGYVYLDSVVERAMREQKPFVRVYPRAPASRCITTLAHRLVALNSGRKESRSTGGR